MSDLKIWQCLSVVACTVIVIDSPAGAHPGHDEHEHPARPPADFVYDTADQTIAAHVLDDPHWYDGDLAARDGQRWFAWLHFTAGKGDQIWVGRRDKQTWQSRAKISDVFRGLARPTLTFDARGRLWLSYEAEVNNAWDIYLVLLDKEGKPSGAPQQVSTAKGADIRHRAAADPQGGLWFVWQSDADGQFDVLARHFNGEKFQPPQRISDNPRGDWHPAVAVDSQGKVIVVWDGYDGDSYNVYARSRRDGNWGKMKPVAQTEAFEGRADVAIDKQDRVWLAWEEGGKNWGKPYRGILTPAIRDELGPLHRFRKLHVAIIDGDLNVRSLSEPLPQPSIAAAVRRPGKNKVAKLTGAFYERARLAVDDAGRVWLAYRHFYAPWLGFAHRSHVEQGWGVYARYYGAEGWSKLHQFNVGQGDGLQRLQLAPAADGIAAVWTTGRTDRRKNNRPRGLVAAEISAAEDAADKLKLQPAQTSDALLRAGEIVERPAVEVAGKRYRLFFGDLHRHTDLSLCRVPIDGTIDDAYRYASDVARLDFLGITDHSRDIALGSALSQLWWRSRKEVYRHELGTRFLPFYAYERSHGNTADHNVISLRGDMLRPHTYPVPKFWEELDENTITIPHQPIRRDTWAYQNDALRPLLEIYQGCRDASIEEHAHRGLGKGYLLGFIASSDHMSTSASYACVWAEEPSRASIFAAMKARRTFGATDKIELAVRAGDHWMGEAITAAELPPLELSAKGTAPIRSVKLIVDGKVEKVFSPKGDEVELRVPLELEGPHYIYFHLTQADGNQAWSSPLFYQPPQVP